MIKRTLKRIRDRLLGGYATTRDLNDLYRNIEGLFQINSAITGNTIIGPLRGWAISPDAMSWLLVTASTKNSPTMIEFGSGQSTIILGALMRQKRGRLYSVEHDSEYLVATRRQLESNGLMDFVELIHAPLVDSDGPSTRSYDLQLVPDITIDVALIDGPPRTSGFLPRLPPLLWSIKHLADDGTVFLDDANRKEDLESIALAMEVETTLELIHRSTEKGFCQIRRKLQ